MNDIAFSVVVKNDGISDIIFKTIMLKGDKGNSVSRVEKTSTSGLVDTYTIYLTDGTAGGTFTVTNGNDINIDDTAVSYSKTWSSQKIKSELDDLSSDVSDALDALSGMIAKTGTIEDVAIASFSDGADDLPVSELIVDIEAWQEGSGEPSPFNVRAIHGWSECNLSRCGVNLFDKTTVLNGYINDASGVYNASNDYKCTDFIRIDGGVDYYIKTVQTTSSWGAWYDENKNFISGINAYREGAVKTSPSNACYIRLTISYLDNGDVNSFGLNYPATDTQYHLYMGDTATIPFGQTVYGAKHDLTNGKLVVDCELLKATDDGSWRFDTSAGTYNYVYKNNLVTKNDLSKFKCNIMPVVNNNADIGITRSGGGFIQIYVNDLGITNLTEWQQYINNNDVYILYPLTTSIDIDLTPIEVRTLLNANNIYADTGNIKKLVYFKTGSEAVARLIEAYMRGNSEPEE